MHSSLPNRAVPLAGTAEDDAPAEEPSRPLSRALVVPLVGIFVILLFTALYFARDIALPVVLALLLAITFSPIVRGLQRRRVPSAVTAVVLVFGLVLTSFSGLFFLSGPVMQWVEAAPTIGQQVQRKLIPLQRPMAAFVQATEAAEGIAEPTEPNIQQVEVKERGMLSWAAGGAARVLGMAGLTFALLLFLLASGQSVHEKIVQVLPTFKNKKRALRIIYDVEHEVSRYLLTVACINTGLGAVVGTAMWLVGMPNPIMWGVAAALLNFIPFLGAAIGMVTVAIVAIVSFDTLSQAMIPPLLYLAATAVEGGIITPLIVGRRLAINTVAILFALALWGWLWGIVGALIAVPLLVAVKAFCDHFEELSGWGEFLSSGARSQPANGNDGKPAATFATVATAAAEPEDSRRPT
jgi:predicted PurR-regulated permease PerM